MRDDEEICPECEEYESDCTCDEDFDFEDKIDLNTAPPSKAYPRLDIDPDELPF